MNIRYNIEEIVYECHILSLRGWIFHLDSSTPIKSVSLVIISASGHLKRCSLGWNERKDVLDAFNLKTNNLGFAFRGSIGTFVSAQVYLEYETEKEINRLLIGDLTGDETELSKERLFIEYPESNGFYNIKNFDLFEHTSRWCSLSPAKQVDVIIPVYNGYAYLHKLFASLFLTTIPMRIIVINDCSTDQRVESFIRNLCKQHDNIVYIKNDSNLGFVKTVNKGLAIAQNHVALVNTDIEVPEGWLERLMYPIFTDENVASTTPYTNCGTLCSFPQMGKDNEIFGNRTLFFTDSIFRKLPPNYLTMPTGVGFCMGMSIHAIHDVGFLDEKNFAKGYGEENDWCQRAIQKGYNNVQVENLYVYHKHGGSFSSAEKKKLLAENTKKLISKHPNYMADVARFFEYDGNKALRTYAYLLCICQINEDTYLCFNHILGGGADDYQRKQKKIAIEKGKKYIEFTYNVYTGNYQVEISYLNYHIKLYANEFEELTRVIGLSNISKIFVNELVTYPNVYDVLKGILNLRKSHDAKLVMLVHDFFCVCPTINLLSNRGSYCLLNCASCKQGSLQENKYIADLQYADIEEWQNNWRIFLQKCTSIIAFSDNSREIIERTYGELNSIKVIPHITDLMLPVSSKYKTTETLNIGVLGVLSDRKGLNIVKQMLAIIDKDNLPVRIVIAGTCEENLESNHCVITGRYTREQLPSLMYLYDIDLIFISSIWPETFSYTAEEAMKMRMPLAVFNMGAPAERVRKYDNGLIIDKLDAKCALDKIMLFSSGKIKKVPAEKFKILFIIEYESFSSRYRVEHFREHLAIRGIYSDCKHLNEIDIADIKEYNIISIYRCSDVEKIKAIVQKAHLNKRKVFYDIDDYIFNINDIQYLEFLKDDEYKDFDKYSNDIKLCMELCDAFTTSTNCLAEGIKKCFPKKEVFVCRNVANLEMQLLSEIAIDHNNHKKNNKVVLGYFSGSKTHNKDWALIEECIIGIMKRYDNIELLICGTLEISDALISFVKRIKKIPFVDWQNLPRLIRSIDINLMPLEDNYFQWCKSENKWMEAGLVKIPTVASKNPELESVLLDGENVIFCSTAQDWERNLEKLIQDEELRSYIGTNANKEVYSSHLVTSYENFAQFIAENTICH